MGRLHRLAAVSLCAALSPLAGAAVVYEQALPSWSTGYCTPCSNDPANQWRAYGSFTLAEDTVLTGGSFAVLDTTWSGRQDISVGIWTQPGGSALFSQVFLQEDYTRTGSQSTHTAAVAFDDWVLAAGTYWISLFGANGNLLSWGTDGRSGDDARYRPNGSLYSGRVYVGFSLSGHAPAPPAEVPVPATLPLLGLGLGLLGLCGRRRSG